MFSVPRGHVVPSGKIIALWDGLDPEKGLRSWKRVSAPTFAMGRQNSSATPLLTGCLLPEKTLLPSVSRWDNGHSWH